MNTRRRGIAQVVDLGHPVGAPARDAGDEVGDAGVALPEALVRVARPSTTVVTFDRLRRVGDVPDLVGRVAERAQQVDLARGPRAAGRCRRRRAPSARRRPPPSPAPRRGCGRGSAGCFGLVTSTIEVPFGSILAGQRVRPPARRGGRRRRSSGRPGCVDRRLVGRARLQVVHAQQPHVLALRPVAALTLAGLGLGGAGRRASSRPGGGRPGPMGTANRDGHSRSSDRGAFPDSAPGTRTTERA